MKKFIDHKTKTIWYYSESGFPTYMAINSYRKRKPSYEHFIASKETWEELTKIENMVQEIPKIIQKNNEKNLSTLILLMNLKRSFKKFLEIDLAIFLN